MSVVLAVSAASIVAYANASEDASDTTTATSVEQGSGSEESSNTENTTGTEESSNSEDISDVEVSSDTGDTADADDTVDVGDGSESVTDVEEADELSGSGLQSDSDTTGSDESLSASALSSGTSLLSSGYEYLDGSGVSRSHAATVVTDSSTTWTSTANGGWYVVTSGSDITISSRVTVSGDVHLILADNAKLTASSGITVNSGEGTLTIYAQSTDEATMGELEATSSSDGDAGIGGTYGNSNGAITINGGTVTATGSSSDYNAAAGIGGGSFGDGSNITINGGTVTAIGSSGNDSNGAGIGGGSFGDGRDITINGGTVTAIGSSGNYNNGAGIGGGYHADGYNIIINGGTVTAIGSSGVGDVAAGIGGGWQGDGYNIKITGGTVTAVGGEYCTGIGAGTSGGAENIVISDGSVKVQSITLDFSIVSGDDAVSVTPTDGNDTEVYCLGVPGMSGVNKIKIDGKVYTRSGDHPDNDGTFYAWVPYGTTYDPDDGDGPVNDDDTDDEDTTSSATNADGDSSDGEDVAADASTSDGVSTGGVLAQTGASVGVLCVLTVVVACGAVAALILRRKHGKEQHVKGSRLAS